MSEDREQSYFVIPLSVQEEGEHYFIGNAELEAFYQFPPQGLEIIRLLQEGRSVEAVEAAMAERGGEAVDVEEFVSTLREIGFIYPPGEEHRFREAVAAGRDADRRLLFRANPTIARTVFSFPSLLIYLGIVGYAAYAAIADPRLRLNLDAFYLVNHLTVTLLLLLLLYAFTASLHELGHMLAAARQGIDSKLGFGNRMWDIVAEADMTGLFSLPRRKRYLPMWAGMMVDVLSISICTLILKRLFETGGAPFAIQLVQALILQICISITWQFSIFMRTDVYYIICNFFGYANLDDKARVFFENQLHAATGGLFGKRSDEVRPEHKAVARAFFAIWLIGRTASIWFLLFVLFPTLYRYFERAYEAATSPYVSAAKTYDLIAFATISTLLLFAGLYFWLKPKKAAE